MSVLTDILYEARTAKRSLPIGWRWVRLGDVAVKVGSGITPLGGYRSYVASGIPLIRSQNVQMNRFDKSGLAYISSEQDAAMENTRVREEDVLLNITGASIGRVCVVPSEFVPANVNQHVSIIRLDGSINPQFLSFYISTPQFQRFILETQAGATRQALTKSLIEDFQIPATELTEQRRIVALLTDKMVAIERTRIAAEAQRKTLTLMTSSKFRREFERGAADWPTLHLAEAAEIVSGVTLGRRLPEKGVRIVSYLRVANVRDGHLHLESVFGTPATEEEIERLRLQSGDILLTEGGDPDKLCRGTFWQEEIPECIHQNHIFRVRFDLNRFSPAFVSAQIGSAYGKRYFAGHAKQTTGIATINRTVLGRFPLLSPPLSVQLEVVAALDAFSIEARKVTEACRMRLETIERLPAAFLRQAFNGEL